MRQILGAVILLLPMLAVAQALAQPQMALPAPPSLKISSASQDLRRSHPVRHRPPQHGSPNVNVIFQAPTYVQSQHNTYTWVNGDPNVAHIQSSRYVMVTDWRRLGLPAPPHGMYWIFEDGRYALVPNHNE